MPSVPHLVVEDRSWQPIRAVAAGDGDAVTHISGVRVLGTGHLAARFAIPPRVLEDTVNVWKRTGGHRRMARTRHGREIWVRRLLKPGAVGHHPFQTGG